MNIQQFWCVWNENGRSPTVKHWTAQSAKTEAERLARLNPGQSFHVLMVVGTCKKQDVEWETFRDDIPF